MYKWFRLSPESQWTGTRVKYLENLVSTTSASSYFLASPPIYFSRLLLRLWNSCNSRDAPSSLWHDFHSDAGISFKESNLTVSWYHNASRHCQQPQNISMTPKATFSPLACPHHWPWKPLIYLSFLWDGLLWTLQLNEMI